MKALGFLFGLLGLLGPLSAFANGLLKSFTPESVLVPLRGVHLSKADHSATVSLYECAGNSESSCMIDLVDHGALTGLFSSQREIEVGVYSRIDVQTCKDEGIYHAKIMGTLQINGQTYYTSSGPTPLTQDLTEKSYVTLLFHGCQRTYITPRQVSIDASGLLDISLFIPLSNIAWGGLAGAPIPEGCVQDDQATMSVCMSYPDATPYIGRTNPIVESYAVYEPPAAPQTSGAQVILLFDSNDGFIGGTTRFLYSETSERPHGEFVTPLRIAEQNSDGTYHLENFGSSGDTSYINFPNFMRADHVGEYISYNWNGARISYAAARIAQ